VFAQGPRRLTAFAGTIAALAIIVTGLVLLTLTLDVLASIAVQSAESQALVWPAFGSLAEGVGAALLIMLTFTLGGAALGVVARSPALSVGLGLVWALVVENLLRGVAQLLGPLETITDVLPGTAAGSLAGALGAAGPGGAAGTGAPGVLTTLTGTSATGLLVVYAVVFLAVMAVAVQRRDA
jgi:ABC-2 type transport system permease protein